MLIMKANKFIPVLFFIAIGLISCTNNDDTADQELIINGTWFLILSCNGDNEECSDIERGNYIFDFNQTNGTVVIEKNGTKFPLSNYEIKGDLLGSYLYINGTNRGRLVTLTSGSLVLRHTQISVFPVENPTTISYYVR